MMMIQMEHSPEHLLFKLLQQGVPQPPGPEPLLGHDLFATGLHEWWTGARVGGFFSLPQSGSQAIKVGDRCATAWLSSGLQD